MRIVLVKFMKLRIRDFNMSKKNGDITKFDILLVVIFFCLAGAVIFQKAAQLYKLQIVNNVSDLKDK